MRPLPWRETYDPYSVWISEIMLQQTQMERGVRYFLDWMRRFPDIRSVAEADEQAIMAAWEGLGYYSRARNLHAAAKRVMERHDGRFPESYDDIRSLPGVGEYTAGAIAAIAFNQPVPAMDANVLRIFSRLFDIARPVSDAGVKAFVTDRVRALIPGGHAREFCQALMELGALVCGKNPKCPECPIAAYCAALRRGTVSQRPVKKAGKGYTSLETVCGLVMRDDRVFIRRRPPRGRWAGLWEFPGGTMEAGETPEQALFRHIAGETGFRIAVRKKIAVVRHAHTTWRVTLHGFLCEWEGEVSGTPSEAETVWPTLEETIRYAFPAGQRKLLEHMGVK